MYDFLSNFFHNSPVYKLCNDEFGLQFVTLMIEFGVIGSVSFADVRIHFVVYTLS